MSKKPKNQPSFFKIMIGDFKNTLRIPPAFTMRYKRFQPMLRTKYILKANRSSCPWPVEVSKMEDGFLFKHGWPSFVENNYIEFGDLLLFTYVCSSEFNVKIYDKTGCEKNFLPKKRSLEQNTGYLEDEGSRKRSKPVALGWKDSCLKKESAKKRSLERSNEYQEHEGSRKRSNPVALDSQIDCLKKRIALNKGLGSDIPLEKGHGCFTSIKRRKGVTVEGKKQNVVAIDASVSLKKQHPHLISTNRKEDGLDLPVQKKTSGLSVLRKKSSATRRRAVTPQFREQGATEVPDEFNFVTPLYRVILKPSYVKKSYMHVSRSFVRYVMKISGVGKDVSKSEWSVRLRHPDGRMWSLRLTFSKAKAYFCGGWAAFLVDNKLREGDICVFECLSVKQGAVEVNVETFYSN